MSGRFMRIRKIIIPTITAVIIASQLCGCASNTQSELHHMIENGDQIEIEVIEPNFEEQGEETTITWTQLADLEKNNEFREEFESILGITDENGIKNGIIYINLDGDLDQNNTLYNAFMNKKFIDNYWNNEEVQKKVEEAVAKHYADIEEGSDSAKYSVLYLYWNLLPDYEPNYANMGASLSRAEAMTFIMRATTPVGEFGVPNTNKTFTDLVGSSDYTDYASYIDNKAFINTSDKSLNTQTFNGTMTKGEFIYLLINSVFGSDAINNVDAKDTKLNDCVDGGSNLEAQGFGKGDYVKSYELDYAIANPDKGAPTSIYKALVKAKQLNIISAETDWDGALTREDAAQLFVDTMIAYTDNSGTQVDSEQGKDNSEQYKAEAESKYEEVKSKLDCTKEEFVGLYVNMRIDGAYEDEALAKCKEFFEIEESETETETEAETEAPTEQETQPSTEKPTQSHKDPEIYYDENGMPYIKEEETTKGNGKYTYCDDINSIDDAINYFKSLGYKLGTAYTLTEDEVRDIYKDFPNAMPKEEFESYMSDSIRFALSALAMYILPPNPNSSANAQENETTSSESNVVIVGTIISTADPTWQPSTQPNNQDSSLSDIYNPYGRPGMTFDDLTPEDNIFN